MFENQMALSDAEEGYKLFEDRKVQKVVFTP
jgi:threonine dehydrogenase-like Zn-dependent dehydrogenase